MDVKKGLDDMEFIIDYSDLDNTIETVDDMMDVKKGLDDIDEVIVESEMEDVKKALDDIEEVIDMTALDEAVFCDTLIIEVQEIFEQIEASTEPLYAPDNMVAIDKAQ
jgi:tetrahydromethanopterin S-methyltransferase subunit G